jgi:hypothetical protein
VSFDLLDDFIKLAELTKKGDSLWIEEPVDLLTFFKSEKFLNETPYPGPQTELLENINEILWWKISRNELCSVHLREVTEYVVLFGKGAGKDFLISGILAYICYMLCCLTDPQKYFNFGQDEPIDLINVAINAYQANNVFFKKLKARLNNCKWFKKVSSNPSGNNEFQLTKNQIKFYKNISAHSAHSEADSFEGFNPLIIIFDEIGGFDYNKAEDCYGTLRSSAATRFGDRAFLMFISFPRSADDFMMKKFAEFESGKDPQVYGVRGSSWEVNPKITRESLEKDYQTDPERSRCRYECIPPAYRDGFFQFPDRIDSSVIIGKFSQCPNLIIQEKISTRSLHTGEQRHFIGLELFNLNLDPSFTYYIGGDAGVNTDSYIICLVHAETTTIETTENGEKIKRLVNKPVEDLLLEWRPSKKDKLPVDLMNVADILEMICKQVFVKKALFDKFNSAEVVQRLMLYGVEAEDKNWSNPFQVALYSHFKGLVYTNQATLLDYRSRYEGSFGIVSPNEEMKAIKILNGNKIDHDKNSSKDFSDARVAAFYLCSTDEPSDLEHFSMPSIIGAKRK